MGVSGANLSPVGDGGDAASCDADRTREVDVRLGAVGVAPRRSTHPRTHTHLGAQSSAWTREPKLLPRSAFRRYRSPAQTSRCVHPRPSLRAHCLDSARNQAAVLTSQIPAANPTFPRTKKKLFFCSCNNKIHKSKTHVTLATPQ